MSSKGVIARPLTLGAWDLTASVNKYFANGTSITPAFRPRQTFPAVAHRSTPFTAQVGNSHVQSPNISPTISVSGSSQCFFRRSFS